MIPSLALSSASYSSSTSMMIATSKISSSSTSSNSFNHHRIILMDMLETIMTTTPMIEYPLFYNTNNNESSLLKTTATLLDHNNNNETYNHFIANNEDNNNEIEQQSRRKGNTNNYDTTTTIITTTTKSFQNEEDEQYWILIFDHMNQVLDEICNEWIIPTTNGIVIDNNNDTITYKDTKAKIFDTNSKEFLVCTPNDDDSSSSNIIKLLILQDEDEQQKQSLIQNNTDSSASKKGRTTTITLLMEQLVERIIYIIKLFRYIASGQQPFINVEKKNNEETTKTFMKSDLLVASTTIINIMNDNNNMKQTKKKQKKIKNDDNNDNNQKLNKGGNRLYVRQCLEQLSKNLLLRTTLKNQMATRTTTTTNSIAGTSVTIIPDHICFICILASLSMIEKEDINNMNDNINNYEKKMNYHRAAVSAMTLVWEQHNQQDVIKSSNISTSYVWNNILFQYLLNITLSQQKQNTAIIVIDLHILSSIAKVLNMNGSNGSYETLQLSAQLIQEKLNNIILLSSTTSNDDNSNDDITTTTTMTNRVSVIMVFATQLLCPWRLMSPIPLITLACQHNLWYNTERMIQYTFQFYKNNMSAFIENDHTDDKDDSKKKKGYIDNDLVCLQQMVQLFIHLALEGRIYRLADQYCTSFFSYGASNRYVEARYLHSCNTIRKAIKKHATPIIEKQVQRIDDAIIKVNTHSQQQMNSLQNTVMLTDINHTNDHPVVNDSDSSINYSEEIRFFAIRQLEEKNDIESAQRLALIWNIPYIYDEEVYKLASEQRKKKYIQYEDVFQLSNNDNVVAIPDVACTPQQLYDAFDLIGFDYHRHDDDSTNNNDKITISGGASSHDDDDHVQQMSSCYGFDVEWDDSDEDEDNNKNSHRGGASLLQISTLSNAILIDIPALSQTIEGADALENTVGRLFSSSTSSNQVIVLGFACRQDIQRLRNSPCPPNRKRHWFLGSNAVRDIQQDIVCDTPIIQHYGLSRCCEYYLGKPLNKAEQCSMWSQRPLTIEQRIYASLDAYVCVAIYQQIMIKKNHKKKT